MIRTKLCTKCGQKKNEQEFAASSSTTDGLQNYCRSCQSEWSETNFDWVMKRNMKYQTKKKQEDPTFVLNQRVQAVLSAFLRRAARNGGDISNTKPESTAWKGYFDFSKKELVAKVQTEFQPGMSWSNYGSSVVGRHWILCHLRPRKDFVFESKDDSGFREYFSLDNLKPIWFDDYRRDHEPEES